MRQPSSTWTLFFDDFSAVSSYLRSVLSSRLLSQYFTVSTPSACLAHDFQIMGKHWLCIPSITYTCVLLPRAVALHLSISDRDDADSTFLASPTPVYCLGHLLSTLVSQIEMMLTLSITYTCVLSQLLALTPSQCFSWMLVTVFHDDFLKKSHY